MRDPGHHERAVAPVGPQGLFAAEIDVPPWKGDADAYVRGVLDAWHVRTEGWRRREYSNAEALMGVTGERALEAHGLMPLPWAAALLWLGARPEPSFA